MAKRKQARRQGSKSTSAWIWLLTGSLIGALVFFGYRQYAAMTAENTDVPIPGHAAAPGKKAGDPASAPAASAEDDGVLDTDYSFYDVLPGEEPADMPAEAGLPPGTAPNGPSTGAAANTSATQDATVKVEPASDASRYLLQAGAFERNADAEDLKARIALSGEPARVESAEVNGKTMYRVRLGPYQGSTAANAAKSNLAGQGIQTVTIKIEQ